MTFRMWLLSALVPTLAAFAFQYASAEELGGEEGFVDSDGVKIHYVTMGKGPLVVLIHGFPDFWYTWRAQMPELAKHFQVVALDMRGYNKSDQPEGVENYKVDKLVGDIDAVVKHFKADKAIIVGHDWGGIVAWSYAMTPSRQDRQAGDPQPAASQGSGSRAGEQSRSSRKPASTPQLSAARRGLEGQARDAGLLGQGSRARKKYIEAFKRSSMEGMLNYYKANYPREPYTYDEKQTYPKIKCPVLMFHGLKDTASARGAERHVGLDRWRPDADHDSRCEPLRAAGRRRSGDEEYGHLADDALKRAHAHTHYW